jgi:hypothetical protein
VLDVPAAAISTLTNPRATIAAMAHGFNQRSFG